VRDIIGKLDNKAAQKCLEVKGVDWRLPVEGESNTHDLHPENYGRVFQRAEIILRKIMDAEAKKPKLITAADVESGNLDPLMLKTVEIIVREVTAHDDALDAVDKHKSEALSFLANLKDRFDKDGFVAFKTKFFPGLSASTVYKRIEVASGKKLLEDLRARNAGYQQKHRDKVAAEQAAKAAPKPKVTAADGKPIDTSGFSPAAKAQLEAELAKAAAEPVVDTEAKQLQRAAVNAAKSAAVANEAKVAAEYNAKSSEPVVEPRVNNDNIIIEKPPEPVRRVTLEDYLGDAIKAEKSAFPAHAICVRCIEYLAPLMNAGTRAQLRKDITAITTQADKAERKAA
jgi:hypothetical protein